MPKKGPKNPYFYFMMDFREEQREKGITYANMNEVQQAADPVWRAASSSIRSKYENKAKAEKAKYKVSDAKFTTTGVPFSEIDNREREAKDAMERELRDIQNFVQQNTFNQKILDEDIYIIDVNSLCYCDPSYVIGEVTVLRFNLRDGIMDNVHERINPPKIPLGYASDIKTSCQELGMDVPDPDEPKTDFLKLLANIIDYLRKGDKNTKVMPPLYTLPEKLDRVQDFMSQLYSRAYEEEPLFRVYKLDLLFFYVINSLKNHNYEGFPKESLALAMLRKDAFKYTPGLGCEHHEEKDKGTECTKARVKRWAYTILDACCPVAGVEAIPGQHIPHDIDIDAVLTLKEKKQEDRRLPVSRAPSSCNSHNTSYDYELPSTSLQSTWSIKPPQKTQPTRKPTVEMLRNQKSQMRKMAPDISESNFPPLNLGSGRGCGRQTSN